MSLYLPPWNNNLKPNQGNVKQWLDNLYAKFQPIEQARWNQSNIDTLFYAGSQSFVNQYFNFSPTSSYQQYYFNLVQQPVNMITGYQRQHRKSANFIPSFGADVQTTDQYTRLMTHVFNANDINETYSRACELAAVSGMVLMQPYLDYCGQDPAQGELKVKVWEYNSFLIDPFFRNADASDAQFIWCQEYISKEEAEVRFPEHANQVKTMSSGPQRYGRFYFLPENYNMARNDLLIVSYVYYKTRRKKQKLYSRKRNQFFDISQNAEMDQVLYNLPDLELVEVEVPSWELAIVLNEQLMWQGPNPLGFDSCPVVPVYWNYDPQIPQYDYRVRSLVRTMRDPQFLMNRQIIISHDQKETTINSGWKRKVGAVANLDNLKKGLNGWDVLINDGYEMTDVEKIMPTVVPESDFVLADRMADFIFKTSGVNLENWSGQEDSGISTLTLLMKQGANLMVLQKYFDQWDQAFKLLADKMLQIVLNNWEPQKIGLFLGEEPSPFFFSKIFSTYQVVVEEGLNTATQKQQEYQQTLELNQALGGLIPPSYIASVATLQGKNHLMEILQQQEQQQAAQAEQAQNVATALEEAKLKELYSKAANNIAMARERHSRSDSNLGLFEERLAEVQKNEAMSLKAKMEALEKMVDVIAKYGEVEESLAASKLENYEYKEDIEQEADKTRAKMTSAGNEFISKMLASPRSNPVASNEAM